MSFPSRLYQVFLLSAGKRRGHWQFTDIGAMQWRLTQLERDGFEYEIYQADIVWKKIDAPSSVLAVLPPW